MIDESRLQGWRYPSQIEHQHLLNKASKDYKYFRPDIKLPTIVTTVCFIYFILIVTLTMFYITPPEYAQFNIVSGIIALIFCLIYNIHASEFNYVYSLIASEDYVLLPCVIVSARRTIRGTKNRRRYYYGKIVTQFDEHCSKEYCISSETYRRWSGGIQDVCYLVRRASNLSTRLFTPY